jgi:transposase-like protein
MGEADQHQQDERNRGEQRVEGQRAGEKRKVVFVGGLQGAPEKAGG